MDSAYISVPKFTEIQESVKKKIYDNCLRKVYSKYCMENIKEKLRNNEFAGTDLQKEYDEAMSYRKEESQDQYFFITICPYEDLDFDQFLKVMEKVLKKKWFQRYIYVYEQRQHDSGKQYFGIHTHIILERNGIAKSDVIREVYNTCKTIVGSKQSIDVKLLKTPHELDVRLNYILGQKSTLEKQKKQVIDKKFRQENNLQQYYSLGNWDTSKYIQ